MIEMQLPTDIILTEDAGQVILDANARKQERIKGKKAICMAPI